MSANLTEIPWHEDAPGEGGHHAPDVASLSMVESIQSYSPPSAILQRLKIMAAIGGVSFVAGLMFLPDRAWGSLLMAGSYLIGVALFGLFFVAVGYVAGAGWGVALRRIPEALTSLLPAGAFAIGLLLVVNPGFYEWYGESEHLTGFKGWWLTYSSLLIRAAIYVVGWFVFSKALVGNSRAQDENGDIKYYRRNTFLAPVALIFFCLSYWLANVDWVMSLEPHWFSTIYGVYHFSGLFIAGLAVTILVVAFLQKTGAVAGAITEDHLQDLGKLLLGFTTFWAYIWFSQYMLIWYADLPEETGHYVSRTSGTWAPIFVLTLILNWVIPFFALLPRTNKRNASTMVKIAAVVLVGHWLDLYVLVYPSFAEAAPLFGVLEVGMAVGTFGVGGWVILNALKKAPLVPLKDPLIEESLHHHQ